VFYWWYNRFMEIPEEIKALFSTRDKAVAKKDRKLFLSTQIAEIEYGYSEGYLNMKNMTSDVLYVYKENELEKIVFVNETYIPKDRDLYKGFLLYFLVNTVKGWKIYKVK